MVARGAIAGGGVGVEIVVAGVELGFCGAARRLIGQIERLGIAAQRLSRLVVLRLLAGQQRIAIELLLKKGLELKVGQLQQLDGLLQLRGHDQTLALAKFQSCSDRHP